jgi:hypothetical protein
MKLSLTTKEWKSSKRCCIFHKQRPFGESSTDSSDYESDHGEGDDGTMAIKAKDDSEKGRKSTGPKNGTTISDFTLNKVGRDFTIARNESIGGGILSRQVPALYYLVREKENYDY